jgi:UDP-N-acetylglucosamine 1-carboxyvinyltransferase
VDALRIEGGAPLQGRVTVSGSKNASLPIMAAALLAEGQSVLHNAPDLADIHTLLHLFSSMGLHVHSDFKAAVPQVKIDASEVARCVAPYELVRTMRAAILVLGPLLARFGHAHVSLPGGCAIGARPIDQHLRGLTLLGADIRIEHGYVVASAKDGLRGCDIHFDMPTVTGTENLMLAATLARGTTVLHNAACEPEIIDLALALGRMGAKISGAGSACLVIDGPGSGGPAQLQPYTHTVVPDRIEFGTLLVAGALAGTPLHLDGAPCSQQRALMDKLEAFGARIEVHPGGSSCTVQRAERGAAVDVQTAPYPGFPTDMQAQLMAALALGQGTSTLTETIFENRFMHVAELDRLGANIRVEGNRAVVQGVQRLSGTTVMATDLRASACLVLAGLMAEGETRVRRIYHLDRGYAHLERKLCSVGARIERFVEISG